MLTDEQELWGCALAIEKQHGDNAPVWIAQRIGELALAGEMEGVELWRAIAAKLDAIRAARASPDRH